MSIQTHAMSSVNSGMSSKLDIIKIKNSMEKDLNKFSNEYQTKGRKHRPNYGNPDGFEPCPFYGACPHIRVEDDEGNCYDYVDQLQCKNKLKRKFQQQKRTVIALSLTVCQ